MDAPTPELPELFPSWLMLIFGQSTLTHAGKHNHAQRRKDGTRPPTKNTPTKQTKVQRGKVRR